MKNYVTNCISESIEAKQKLQQDAELVLQIGEQVASCIEAGGKLLLCGNGGSAADSQHIATELVHQFEVSRRKAIPALALTTDTSMLSAIGNDWGFDEVYSRQVEALCTANDILIALSTSGNSTNVLKAVEAAKGIGAKTVGFAGKGGGKLKDLADLALVIESDNTARIQECHILAGHIICGLIEKRFS